MSYDIGDRRKLTNTIRDEAGELADPDVLFFQIRTPDGTTTTYQLGVDDELVKDSVGVFHVHWDCALAGSHYGRWIATGSLAVAEAFQFRVSASVFSELPA